MIINVFFGVILNKNPQRITNADKKMTNDLHYANVEFPVSKKDYKQFEQKIIFALKYSVLKMF